MALRSVDEVRATCDLLLRAHRSIETTLGALEVGALRLRNGLSSKHRFEDAIYELYVRFEDHLVEEELLLDPIARIASSDELARIRLVLSEHDDQRRVFLHAVAQAEEGVLEAPALLALSASLVRMVRADIDLEDELFRDLRRLAR